MFGIKMNVEKVISAHLCQLTNCADIASFADVDDALKHMTTLAHGLLANKPYSESEMGATLTSCLLAYLMDLRSLLYSS